MEMKLSASYIITRPILYQGRRIEEGDIIEFEGIAPEIIARFINAGIIIKVKGSDDDVGHRAHSPQGARQKKRHRSPLEADLESITGGTPQSAVGPADEEGAE